MKTFILLSFGLLGLVFYELSGGADFDAGAIREARLAALSEQERARAERRAEREAEVVVAEAPTVFVDTDPPLKPFDGEVTRVSLNLTTLESPTGQVSGAQQEQADAAPSQAEPQAPPVPRNVPVVTASADTPAIIPSLINPSDGVTAPAQQQSLFEDVRTVSGNRVNVRGGPGTDFGVVGRMVRGDAVIILEDNGDGWVRFESMDGTTEGWMADFLLSES